MSRTGNNLFTGHIAWVSSLNVWTSCRCRKPVEDVLTGGTPLPISYWNNPSVECIDVAIWHKSLRPASVVDEVLMTHFHWVTTQVASCGSRSCRVEYMSVHCISWPDDIKGPVINQALISFGFVCAYVSSSLTWFLGRLLWVDVRPRPHEVFRFERNLAFR